MSAWISAVGAIIASNSSVLEEAERMTPAIVPGRSERPWWTLLAVSGAMLMLLVDITIVQVALPTIQRSLGASFSDVEWVISGYALALAALILTGGTLADRFGRKRIFAIGLAIFTLASLLCGLATSSAFLIAARALQGVGGAAMFATSLALIGQEFRGRQLVTAIAVWGSVTGGGVSIGPLVGGALTTALGWQWIFFVNVPIGVATLALTLTRMVNVRDPQAKRLDWPGLITFSAALFLLVYGLVRGNDDGWSSPTILAVLGLAVLLLVAFTTIEIRQPYAMFDMSLFRKPAFTGVSIATFMIAAGMFSMLVYITLYLQNQLGYSPLQGGLRLLPTTLLVFIVPLASRRLVERVSPGVSLGGGMLLVGVGLLLMRASLSDASDWTALLPGLLVAGLGIGFANPAIGRIALRVVPLHRSGMASGISNTFRVAGLSCGVAALGAVFQQRVANSLTDSLGAAPVGLARAVVSGGAQAVSVVSRDQVRVASAAHVAFISALDLIIVVGAVVVLAGAVAAVLVRRRDFQTQPVSPPVEPTRPDELVPATAAEPAATM
jgi:EmrB/QacA subfamily drug resistance transporter